MDEVEKESIHLCLTDPPYGLDKMGSDWTFDKVHDLKNMNAVTSLPSGMKFDPNQGKTLYDWMLPVSQKIYEKLVPGAFYLVFCAPRLYHRVACAVEDAGFYIKDMYLWMYTQNQPKAMGLDYWISKSKLDADEKEDLKEKAKGWKTPQVRSNHEPIVFAQKPLEGNFVQNFKKHGVGLVNTNLKIGCDNDRFPSNVLADNGFCNDIERHFLVPKPTKKEKGEENTHKTVKPLNLCEYLIQSLTQKDQVVLDPFAGSGTTLVAAKNSDRKYCGIELNKEYIDIIKRRLEV